MLCLFVTVEFQVVSEDGKKVRRQQPFTESDVEELQVLSNLLLIPYFFISGDNTDMFYFLCSLVLLLPKISRMIIVTKAL